MDEARIREQIVASERIEVDGANLRIVHQKLDQALEHRRIRKGERTGAGRLRSESECWDLVEEVYQHLSEGIRLMDAAIEQAVQIIHARGPCDDPECRFCHPPPLN